MWACFHMAGMALFNQEKLKMSVSAVMAIGPKCLRCKFVMRSGPEDFLSLSCVTMRWVSEGVNGGGEEGMIFRERLRLLISLL